MNSYAAGTTVTLSIPFEDLNGETLEPTALSWRLLDQYEEEILPSASIALVPAETETTITVPGSSNALLDGEIDAVREVELTITTAAGLNVIRYTYFIKSPVRLKLLVNSFQTYSHACLTADGIHGLDGWAGASEQERCVCLQEAYLRITRVGFRVRFPDAYDTQAHLSAHKEEGISPRMWSVMSIADYANVYPEVFRAALRRAQVAEADSILGGNIIAQRRELGLLSETIGQSSMMFRSGKPLNFGISAAALRYLEGYVDIKMMLTRT